MKDEYILQMQGITKIYDNGFIANKSVDLNVRKGEIHALIGENGAGKTTLMKILFGMENCQEGKILIKGQEVSIPNPLKAIDYGIGMVHQHFMQVPKFTVAENIMLGVEPVKGLVMNRKKIIETSQAIADQYGFNLDVKMRLGDLSIGIRQKVEILKILVRGVELLILDEPTAVLTPQETGELFEQLKQLRDTGLSIIFISHKLDEVMNLCDRVTILRDGHSVGSDEIANLTQSRLAQLMVGREILEEPNTLASSPGRIVAEVRDLVYVNSEQRRIIDALSLNIREGEIVGIAAVEGNGQNELCDILTGMLPVLSGTVKINGKSIQGKSVNYIRSLGVAHVTEDRLRYGCANTLSIRDNILANRLSDPEFIRGKLFINAGYTKNFVNQCIENFEIKCDDLTSPIKHLSGGNIQKVIVAREFTMGANLIVANQPTRGIDIGATEFIRQKLIEMSRQNKAAVLLVSADLNEILALSDRIAVLYKGQMVAHWPNARAVTAIDLGEYMLGIRRMSPEQMGDAV